MAKILTPQQIQATDLPRARRGYEQEATRELLANAVASLTAVTKERDDLAKEVASLREQVARVPTDADTIAAVLVTAHNAGEELLAKARAEADQLRGSAERQRDDLLHAARAQADAITTDAGASLESLRARTSSSAVRSPSIAPSSRRSCARPSHSSTAPRRTLRRSPPPRSSPASCSRACPATDAAHEPVATSRQLMPVRGSHAWRGPIVGSVIRSAAFAQHALARP